MGVVEGRGKAGSKFLLHFTALYYTAFYCILLYFIFRIFG